MAIQGAQLAPACYVPELNGVVQTGRSQRPPIGTESYGVYWTSMAGFDDELRRLRADRGCEEQNSKQRSDNGSFHGRPSAPLYFYAHVTPTSVHATRQNRNEQKAFTKLGQ